jgi:hypothetical protein
LTDFTIEMGMDEGAFRGLLLGLGNSILANTGATDRTDGRDIKGRSRVIGPA